MMIEPFRINDIATFLELAATEGWVAEAWEFDFLLATFPAGSFCMRDESGTGVGFVTSMRHDRSGWIGNLIVGAEHRGRGIGETLFLRAIDALRDAGAETIWLTASKTGKSIYEKHGFTAVDTIFRWTGVGRQRHSGYTSHPDGSVALSSASGIDNQAWGDRREALLAATAGRGRVLVKEPAFLVIQPCGEALQFGPFSALDTSRAEQLFDAALCSVPCGTKVYLDAPASNRAAMRFFKRRRMRIAGANELMYAGNKPLYRPEYIFGLATMGSCG